MKFQIHAGAHLREYSRGHRSVAFILHDGSCHVGKAVVDSCRVDLPPRLYFQASLTIYETEEVSVWALLNDGQGPCESWDIWKDASTLPAKGEQIVYWDTDAVRKGYSGPYWHVAPFGTDNRRYQNASGPFVGGEPWKTVKSWVSLEDLVQWLGLRDVPWIKSDARSGVAAFTRALSEAGVHLRCGEYAVDDHFQKYGFSYLTSGAQAVQYILDLVDVGCHKGRVARSMYAALTESGTLTERFGMSQLELARMALAKGRRTHCACHETGSFAPR